MLLQKLTKFQIADILLRPTNYFEIADEYIELQGIFIKEGWIENLGNWMDMVFYPIFSFIMYFAYGHAPSIFTLLSLHKTITLWTQWFRFKTLTYEIREWMKLIRSIGGPFISTNDPTYHVFVYADAMQRIQNELLRLTKKGAKCAK